MKRRVGNEIYDSKKSNQKVSWEKDNKVIRVFETETGESFKLIETLLEDGTTDECILTQKEESICAGCPEAEKDWCTCAAGHWAKLKRKSRQKKIDIFNEKYFLKLKELYPIEYIEKQDKYKITTSTHGVVNFYPKSDRIYIFNEKKWHDDGIMWIKQYLGIEKPKKFNNEKYVIDFGKYRGKIISEMTSPEEMKYCVWALNNIFNDMSELRKIRSKKYNAFYYHVNKKELI